LRALEANNERSHVKVCYIGYGAEWDEWRSLEDIVELSDSSSLDEATTTTPAPSETRFYLN